MKNIWKYKKNIFLVLAVLFVFSTGFLFPHTAAAGFLDILSPSTLIVLLFKGIAYIVNFIGGLFFAFAAALVKFAFYDLNLKVTDLGVNKIVDVGWRICRDIANLGFVLTTVIMAFTTIIRVQSYGAKKLLVNLIVAAIMVNFSFVIAGTLIDFSNALSNFFISRIDDSGAGTGLTATLANAFGPQKYLLEDSQDPLPPNPSEEESGIVSFGMVALTSIAGLIFTVIFTLLSTIVLLMLAFMFVIRYIALTFLLILAPLAWLASVFPGLKGQNSDWWKNFSKWNFFAPAVSLFVYLSLIAAEGLSKAGKPDLGNGFSSLMLGIMQQGVQMIVVGGLMVGGILVAEKMGIAGAKSAMGAAKSLKDTSLNVAKNRAQYYGQKLSQTKAGATVSRWAKSAGVKIKETGEKAQNVAKNAKIKAPEDEKFFGSLASGAAWKRRGINALTFAGRKGLGGFGKGTEKAGTTIEKGGKAIDKTAVKEPVKKQGVLGSVFKGALEGGGLMKKQAKETKDKDFDDYEKELKELAKQMDNAKKLKNPDGTPRFGDKDLKDIQKKIDKVKSALNKAQDVSFDDQDSLIKAITDIKERRDKAIIDGMSDTSFYNERITQLTNKLHSLNRDDLKDDPIATSIEENIGKILEEREALIKQMKKDNPKLSVKDLNEGKIADIDTVIEKMQNASFALSNAGFNKGTTITEFEKKIEVVNNNLNELSSEEFTRLAEETNEETAELRNRSQENLTNKLAELRAGLERKRRNPNGGNNNEPEEN